MATVVVGTAGHIDHGKTTLLRALTGIDADRLPEERERGMTIDVGFAHLDLADGSAIDFVDVPGHDRLVGNMLVGAGEIDAVLLVVAADDGPRAQTLEHLELLDALGLRRAIVAITKSDVTDPIRVAEVAAAVHSIVERTTMAGASVVEVSATTGTGLSELRQGILELVGSVQADWLDRASGPLRLPIDRAFGVRGRGVVVTGTLRGGAVEAGTRLRLEPDGGREARVREVQVHHGPAGRADGGRTALNLAGIEARDLGRGRVLTAGSGVEATDRLLVELRPPLRLGSAERGTWPPSTRADLRLHLWTDAVDASVDPTGTRWVSLPGRPGGGERSAAHDRGAGDRLAALVRLARPVAALIGAHAVLRDPGSGQVVAGAVVLDPRPPRGLSRRRATADRLAALAAAVEASRESAGAPDTATDRAPGGYPDRTRAALTDLHGWRDGMLAPDVREALVGVATERAIGGGTRAALRADLLGALRRSVTVDRWTSARAVVAIDRVLADLIQDGRLAQDGDRLVEPAGRGAAADSLAAAMSRLETALDATMPPSLAAAVQAAGCPPEGVRQLESSGRIVRVEDDLAWSAARYAALRDLAVSMARPGPLAPAAFRDAIGANRRVALALLEDLGRRGILRRTDAGHVPGPRAPR